ncbi:MAG: peptidase M14 family protein, partial [Acidobacteria bacterium]|nr:peptidase M14 family protein [Acidobacteriota bacterium]
MQARASIPSPEDFFGFKMGTARHIARWDNIVEYFYVLEKNSDKLKVVDMGPSTMGHPFLVVFISSADNLNRMNELQSINARLSDPRGVPEEEIQTLIQKGTAVICQSMSLHATEIGGTQMAVELTHDLLTGEDDETLRILDNVMFVMIPSFNPDGQIMVTDWYRKTVGTEYEGSNLPWLYHKYGGHDNNRDGDFLNMIESVYAAKIMFRDWIPQAYIDHHHMGSYGARFYIPPYCDPIRPYADPLVWREHGWYGAHIAYKLEEEGKQGILNAAQYPGWGHFGWHWITPFHNIAG